MPKIDSTQVRICMFTAQGPSVFHVIEVAVVQFAQVRLVSMQYDNYSLSIIPCRQI